MTALDAEPLRTGDVKVFARVRAFTGQGPRRHVFAVSPEGVIRVWDPVAGHYTTCWALGPAAVRKIRALAGAHQ